MENEKFGVVKPAEKNEAKPSGRRLVAKAPEGTYSLKKIMASVKLFSK